MTYENEEQLTIYSIMEYISEHFVGLILLLSSFLIIYFVDYINRLNSMLFTPTSPNPMNQINKMNPIKLKPKKR